MTGLGFEDGGEVDNKWAFEMGRLIVVPFFPPLLL